MKKKKQAVRAAVSKWNPNAKRLPIESPFTRMQTAVLNDILRRIHGQDGAISNLIRIERRNRDALVALVNALAPFMSIGEEE